MANTGVSCDPYMHHFPVGRPPIPRIYTHGAYYGQLEIGGSSSISNSETDYERAYFKRKSFAHPVVLDARNSNEHHSARSSDGVSITSDQYIPNPILEPHNHSSISMLSKYTSNSPSTIGEGLGSNRNVRSRHGQAFHLQNNLVSPHPSSNLSRHFPQNTSILGHAAMSSDSGRRFSSSGFFLQEMNPPIESSGVDSTTETAEEFSYFVSSRHRDALVSTLLDTPMQDDINYGHRLNAYSSTPRNTTIEDVRQFGNEVFPHSTHHRQSWMPAQSSERYGRARSSYDSLSYRMNMLANEGHTHGRWNTESFYNLGSQNAMMIDSSVFNDPHAMFDQHGNMRMDIDNMSYEELIDLGERIGTVSTGLSGADIARCLTIIIYSFDRNQDAEKGSCVICLEEYKDRQSIGRLNCRHDFHSRCIKKWLLIKNACPVCKSAALGDKLRGKQLLL
ncbi:uncharacterized protein LOC110038783 [Phalaenopsis equestris]|uniref:uncharacterized protein LOC110038783 n=1 Tax=Phalaenopsis equestris TaxID=78828 RepID=UPI0009E1FE71|nr:uncharacterized protein LOC110038783 [Phalaenopsis equestris]